MSTEYCFRRLRSPQLLSVGPRDELALAVRLAMARRFLKEGGGFLLLDDPLVDLDPRRPVPSDRTGDQS